MRRPSSPFGLWFGHTLHVGAAGVSQNGKLKDSHWGRWNSHQLRTAISISGFIEDGSWLALPFGAQEL